MACVMDDNDERVKELKESTGLPDDLLRFHLIKMAAEQFASVPEDPTEYTHAKMTFGALLQAIYNDMLVMQAPQDVLDALQDVRHACDKVVETCSKHADDVKAQAQAEG